MLDVDLLTVVCPVHFQVLTYTKCLFYFAGFKLKVKVPKPSKEKTFPSKPVPQGKKRKATATVSKPPEEDPTAEPEEEQQAPKKPLVSMSPAVQAGIMKKMTSQKAVLLLERMTSKHMSLQFLKFNSGLV